MAHHDAAPSQHREHRERRDASPIAPGADRRRGVCEAVRDAGDTQNEAPHLAADVRADPHGDVEPALAGELDEAGNVAPTRPRYVAAIVLVEVPHHVRLHRVQACGHTGRTHGGQDAKGRGFRHRVCRVPVPVKEA